VVEDLVCATEKIAGKQLEIDELQARLEEHGRGAAEREQRIRVQAAEAERLQVEVVELTMQVRVSVRCGYSHVQSGLRDRKGGQGSYQLKDC
jgi:hypothetical protein